MRMMISLSGSAENLDIGKLYALQEKLAKKVSLKDHLPPDKIEYVAGCDLAYSGERVFCAIVVLNFSSLEIIREKVVKTDIRFPYIPTLLAFREKDPILKAVKGVAFDVLMVDGQGIAHPRGLGIASHIGVMLNKPTIGVAKSRLCGEVQGEFEAGKTAPLIYEGRQVGHALVAKKNTRPIYISPGHKVSLDSSLEIVQRCIRGHKLPEPTRLAHLKAEATKRTLRP